MDVLYNDQSVVASAVTWDETQVTAIDTSVGGTYAVTGSLEDGTTVNGQVEVIWSNMVQNPSFEDADTSMWKVTYAGDVNPTDYQVKADDAYSGEVAFHFNSADSDMDFAIEQEFMDLAPGTYQLSAFAQGGDMDATAQMELYAVTSDGEQTAPFMVTTWVDWKNPTIPEIKITDGTLTIGVRIKCNPASWGTVDEFTLNRIGD